MDVVGLRVVADSVAIRNEGPKTHHAVRVSGHLMERQQHRRQKKKLMLTEFGYDVVKTFITNFYFLKKITSENAAIFSEKWRIIDLKHDSGLKVLYIATIIQFMTCDFGIYEYILNESILQSKS